MRQICFHCGGTGAHDFVSGIWKVWIGPSATCSVCAGFGFLMDGKKYVTASMAQRQKVKI